MTHQEQERRVTIIQVFICAIVAVVLIALAGCAPANMEEKYRTVFERPEQTPRVYVFSGAFDAFNSGVITLAQRIEQKCDSVVSVHRHWVWNAMLDDARAWIAKGHPIVVVGHSMGGTDGLQFAQALAPAKVALVVTLDPSGKGSIDRPANVEYAVNYRQETTVLLGGGKPKGVDVDYVINYGHVGYAQNVEIIERVAAHVCSTPKG